MGAQLIRVESTQLKKGDQRGPSDLNRPDQSDLYKYSSRSIFNNIISSSISVPSFPISSEKDTNSRVPSNSQTKYMVDIDVQVPTTFDPFADTNDDSGAPGAKEYVHIRVQQRNGRKSLTTVQGLKKEFSYEKILKDLKKEFCCNGTVVQDKELGKVIQLQGDQRKNVSSFLVTAGIVKKERIKIHGF